MESSRVEYMAQKQNKIAQHLLSHKIGEIDKEFTLAKLQHRMFIKQLRYDMSQFKKSTGNSSLARPPTGEQDRRNSKTVTWKLPKVKRSSLPIMKQATSSADRALVTQSHDSTFLTQATDEEDKTTPMELLESNGSESSPTHPEKKNKRRKSSSDQVLAKANNANSIIKMPSIFQTSSRRFGQNSKSFSGFLPKIETELAGGVITIEPIVQEEEISVGESSPPQNDKKEIRISFTPKTKAKPTNQEQERKKADITQILQESLKKASEKRKAEARMQQRRRAKAKLAIEEPFGLYRPDNVKLINKMFKQEDLHNQHRVLLEQNSNASVSRAAPKPSLNKLEGRLQAFLNQTT